MALKSTLVAFAVAFVALSLWGNAARVAKAQATEAHTREVAALKAENAALRLLAAEAIKRLDEQERLPYGKPVPGTTVGFYGTRLETYGGELAPGVVGNLAYDATPGGSADHLFCTTRGPDGRVTDVRYAGRPGDTGYPPCPKQ